MRWPQFWDPEGCLFPFAFARLLLQQQPRSTCPGWLNARQDMARYDKSVQLASHGVRCAAVEAPPTLLAMLSLFLYSQNLSSQEGHTYAERVVLLMLLPFLLTLQTRHSFMHHSIPQRPPLAAGGRFFFKQYTFVTVISKELSCSHLLHGDAAIKPHNARVTTNLLI